MAIYGTWQRLTQCMHPPIARLVACIRRTHGPRPCIVPCCRLDSSPRRSITVPHLLGTAPALSASLKAESKSRPTIAGNPRVTSVAHGSVAYGTEAPIADAQAICGCLVESFPDLMPAMGGSQAMSQSISQQSMLAMPQSMSQSMSQSMLQSVLVPPLAAPLALPLPPPSYAGLPMPPLPVGAAPIGGPGRIAGEDSATLGFVLGSLGGGGVQSDAAAMIVAGSLGGGGLVSDAARASMIPGGHGSLHRPCSACRTSKVKCDYLQPCTRCVRVRRTRSTRAQHLLDLRGSLGVT